MSWRWPCFGRGVGLDDPQRSLPNPTILWFCDSVSPFIVLQNQFRWFDLLSVLCLMHTKRLLASFAARAHCLLMGNLVSTKTTSSFSANLVASTYWCIGLFLLWSRTWLFSLLNFIRVSSALFSRLIRSFWMAAQQSGEQTTPLHFVLSAVLPHVQEPCSFGSIN